MNVSTFLKLIFLLLLTSCTTSRYNSSNYQTVYSTTINDEEHEIILELLKSKFADFPNDNKKNIKYLKQENEYSLKIKFKRDFIKIKYHNDLGKESEIKSLISDIETITSN